MAGFALAFGVPAALWWARGRVLGGSEYVSEFWLIDPYQPHLGTVGPGGLLDRLTGNFVSYVTRIIPAGVAGDGLPIIPPIGVGLGLVTLVGWFRVLRDRVGAAELFFPLYFGLILLWPPAWSGDRFALPLLPLMFFYSGVALLWLFGSFPVGVRRVAVGVLVLALAIPAGLQLRLMAKGAGDCRELTRTGNARECLSPAQGEYFALAEWSGENLPDGAVVTTRKPRIFFLMSGVKAQVHPPGDRSRRVPGAGAGRGKPLRFPGSPGWHVRLLCLSGASSAAGGLLWVGGGGSPRSGRYPVTGSPRCGGGSRLGGGGLSIPGPLPEGDGPGRAKGDGLDRGLGYPPSGFRSRAGGVTP